MEWNTRNDTFVALLDVVGTLYNAPAGDTIFVTNTDNSTSAVVHPRSKCHILLLSFLFDSKRNLFR